MQRSRSYFLGTGGDKFLTGNKPTQATFQDLLDSAYFKAETGDRATNAVYGVTLLATTAISKARSGAGVALPNHLPVMTYGGSNTELITPGAQSYQGIKVTAVDKTDRLDYQVDFDPTSLTAKVTPALTDYAVIVDVADSNKPKKVLLSNFIGVGSGSWTRTSTTLAPTNAGDLLDMGTGSVTGASFLLTAAASTYINPLSYTGNDGSALFVSAGAGQHASSAKNGGALYLKGGAAVNGGTVGDTFLAWDGSNIVGDVSVRGVKVAGYNVTVHGKVYHDGLVHITPAAPPGGGVTVTTAPVYGSDGIIYYQTFKDFMSSILGAVPAADSILTYQGSAYTAIAIGATKDAFLHTNASTGALEMALLDMTNRVTNSSVAAGANIAWNKMVALTASQIMVTDAGGVPVASGVAATALNNIANTNYVDWSYISVNTSWTAATIHTINRIVVTGGGVKGILPKASTITAGLMYQFTQVGAGGSAKIGPYAGDAFIDVSNAGPAEITLGGAGSIVRMVSDGVSTWTQI